MASERAARVYHKLNKTSVERKERRAQWDVTKVLRNVLKIYRSTIFPLMNIVTDTYDFKEIMMHRKNQGHSGGSSYELLFHFCFPSPDSNFMPFCLCKRFAGASASASALQLAEKMPRLGREEEA